MRNTWIHVADALPITLVNQGRGVAENEWRFHSGRLLAGDFGRAVGADELGPMLEPVIRPKNPPADKMAGFAFDVNGKISGAWTQSVHHVLEVSACCFAQLGELIALVAVHRGEETFEVHDRKLKPIGFVLSTPFGFDVLLYCCYE